MRNAICIAFLNHISKSSALHKPGQQAPQAKVRPSSVQPQARARHGTHQPGQAHGQILPGLKPEGANVSE
ncbi:hypothetical protein Pyn_16760 [Prunus yedoensis var. nudiflora]|uniref:Uncharacterized protein n=1 Tax=Prunus yedoensis var. nudiflora TaxID=2094558 RepID=A0A314UUB8_PRUYE|nr:hypothetical protein Pyn_16760 [Prunus yedoensis var. nudiflora]